MPLIDSWTRWSILSGGATAAPPGVAAAMLQVEMGMIAVEQGVVEAAVQPAAPFAMQGRGDEVPDADEAGILEDHEEDEKARTGEQRTAAASYCPGSWKKAIELTSSPEASASQTLVLLDSRGEQGDHDGQRPGFLPASENQ